MKLSYLDAYYYKLLLEVGYVEDVNNWITNIANDNESLEGIYLDLVCSLGDYNATISCLYNYIGENIVDDDALATRLRLFVLDKYENGEIDLYKAAESLIGFVNLTDKYHNKNFYSFSLIGEAYSLMYEGMIKKENFENIVINHLKTGEYVDYDSLFEKVTFKSILKKEKQEMNKIRSIINYIVVPIILIITCLILVSIFILLTINEEKYTFPSIILFIVIGIIYLSLLVSLPFIRKKELQIELSKYDFTIDDEIKEEYIVNTTSSIQVIFKKDGLYIENKYYKYDDLSLQLSTSNYLLKVSIYVDIIVKNTNSYIKPYWHINLNKEVVNSIIKYNIKIENKEKLLYIINNKKDAFNQILSYGYIKRIK